MAQRDATAQQFADPEDVAAAARHMTQAQLECRSLGHNWRPLEAEWSAADNAYDVSNRCVRCRTVRVMLWNARGHVISSHYEYPDGYLMVGLGRVVGEGRDALRLESVGRFLGANKRLRKTG